MGYTVRVRANNGRIISSRARDKRQAEALARISMRVGGKYISIRKIQRRG